MGFRDETETLRARVASLEEELRTIRREREQAVAKLEEISLHRRDDELVAKAERSAARTAQIEGVFRWVGMAAGVLVSLGLLVVGAQSACTSCTFAEGPGVDASGAPSVGMLDVDMTPDPAALDLVASGDRSAPDGCAGYIPAAPQLVVRSAHEIALRVAPASSGDLVAVVLTPDGRVLCDDDDGGSLNPLVIAVAPPGDTRIWIGTYQGGESTPFRLALHVDRVAELEGSTSAPVLEGPGPESRGTWSGSVVALEDASLSAPTCRGYLSTIPALTVRLSEPAAVRLDASGADDLVLLVRESDGHVKCDDDGGPGNSPRIAAMLPAGEHRVYVGTYASLGRPAAFALSAEVIRVDPLAAPTLGSRPLAATGEMLTFEARSSGALSPTALGASCTGGLVAPAPSVALEVTSDSDVAIAVGSATPTFLVIAHPDRTFECVMGGYARRVLTPGLHRLYVGVPDEGMPSDFTLTVRTESPTLRPWTPP